MLCSLLFVDTHSLFLCLLLSLLYTQLGFFWAIPSVTYRDVIFIGQTVPCALLFL